MATRVPSGLSLHDACWEWSRCVSALVSGSHRPSPRSSGTEDHHSCTLNCKIVDSWRRKRSINSWLTTGMSHVIYLDCESNIATLDIWLILGKVNVENQVYHLHTKPQLIQYSVHKPFIFGENCVIYVQLHRVSRDKSTNSTDMV